MTTTSDDDDADMVNDAAKEPDSLEKRQRDATKAGEGVRVPFTGRDVLLTR